MHRARIVWLLLAGMVCTGCQKPAAAPPPSPPPMPGLPIKAQPTLKTTKIWLGPEELITELAITGEEQQTGMMFRTNMPENAGMLFVFPIPHQTSFWMMNTVLPLSAAYIDLDGIIQELHDLKPLNTNSVVASSDRIQFVLEVNQGWFQRHHISTGTLVRAESGPLRALVRRR